MSGKLVLKRGEERRLRAGHLWIYKDEVVSLELEKPGGLVHVIDSMGHSFGTAYANPASQIVARMMSKKNLPELKTAWWQDRLQVALKRRQWLFNSPHYRWIHGEGDGLPGLIIDRYGDDLVIQAHTAGIDVHTDNICEALQALVKPRNIYLHNQTPSRLHEGLEMFNRVYSGDGDGSLIADEGGTAMHCHALDGQKTGYFYDQRPNRAWISALSNNKRVLDLFCYVGAFSVQALKGGASQVVSIDASQTALDYAGHNIEQAGLTTGWQARCADVMKELQSMDENKERFDIVICDPPAFVKNRKKMQEGLRGYERLMERATRLVAPGGMLCAASCSGLVGPDDFRKSVNAGIRNAGRKAQVVYEGGAGGDHPWSPSMPETRYLKFLGLMLD